MGYQARRRMFLLFSSFFLSFDLGLLLVPYGFFMRSWPGRKFLSALFYPILPFLFVWPGGRESNFGVLFLSFCLFEAFFSLFTHPSPPLP
ncbi:hypothetical protein DFP73DRAFT_17667 [Morchella snyderi]|nr:hypothetical protein DFP73DRAFT_17667 [Morchella snyderi]